MIDLGGGLIEVGGHTGALRPGGPGRVIDLVVSGGVLIEVGGHTGALPRRGLTREPRLTRA